VSAAPGLERLPTRVRARRPRLALVPAARPARRGPLHRSPFVAVVVVLQLAFVARGYTSDHRELGWQMFPEASTWRADVVRVTASGRRGRSGGRLETPRDARGDIDLYGRQVKAG